MADRKNYPPFTGLWTLYRDSTSTGHVFTGAFGAETATLTNSINAALWGDLFHNPSAWTMDGVNQADADVTVFWRWSASGNSYTATSLRGMQIGARMTGGNLGYRASFRAQTGNVTISVGDGATFSSTKSFSGFTQGQSYGCRFQVSEGTVTGGGTGSHLRMKVWAASGAEPEAWDYEVEIPTANSLHVSGAGAVGLMNGGGASISNGGIPDDFGRVYTIESVFLDGDAVLVSADASDRLRSSVSETTGSLLDAVDVRAVDASVSEAYTYAQRLDPAVLTSFRELLRSRDSVTVDFAYYPRPRPNVEMENQYSGVTLLSRLATYYPQRILDTVDADGLNIVTSGAATAQQIISYVLGVWAADTGWLTYETVPDLRVRMPGLNAPSDYTAGVGVATSNVVALPQDGNNRKDALTILKELLSPFPGTVVRQNSAGNLEIVPAYGPDADATPFLTLDTRDLESVSIGEADPFGIINRATFTSRGYEITENAATMQPAWFQIGSLVQHGRSNWYTPPVDRENLQPFEDDTATAYQETLTPSSSFTAQTPGLWPVSTDSLPAGEGISLLDETSAPMVSIAWARYFNDSLVSSGTNGLTITTPVIPFSGAWVTAFSVDFTTGGESVRATIRAKWNAARQGVEFQLGTPMKLETDCFTGCNGIIIEFNLNDSSVGWVPSVPRSATFGIVDDPTTPTADDDSLPAADGGNAIADSQVEYGVLERNVNIEGYAFTSAQLAEMARGFVIQNITPKVVREIEVSALSGFRVPFDAIGRLVELPNGDQGRVTGVSYADDFTSLFVRKTATIEIPNPIGAGFIPVDTSFVLTESGGYWLEEETGLPVQEEG